MKVFNLTQRRLAKPVPKRAIKSKSEAEEQLRLISDLMAKPIRGHSHYSGRRRYRLRRLQTEYDRYLGDARYIRTNIIKPRKDLPGESFPARKGAKR